MNDKFDSLFAAVSDEAKKLGIGEFELYYSEGDSISCDTYKDEISSFSSSTGGSLSFRCIVGDKMGYASTQLFNEEEMRALVSRASENSRVIEKTERAIIYGGGGEYKKVPEHDFIMPTAASLKDFTMSCRNTLYGEDPMIADGTSCGAWASNHFIRLFNSKGLNLSCRGGSNGVAMDAVLDNGTEKQSAYEFKFDCMNTLNKKELAAKTVTKAKEKFGAGLVNSGKYNIVFDGKQMRDFLSTFACCFFAERSQKGLSMLNRGMCGQKIASDCVTIIDTPFHPENTLQMPFDGEGVPSREKKVIENGIFKTMLYNLTSAEKDGVETTGNASRSGASIGTRVFTFYIEPGKASREELFAAAGNGIYVTEMKGFHAGADEVTGDFSIESAGFLIENGKKTSPVKSFTIAGNFFDLLKNISVLGNEIDFGGPGHSQIASPDVLVPGMSVAGK